MTRETVLRAVRTYVPIVTWLPAYPADWRRPDLVAGITSWGVMIPVAMAYAELAGVPAAVGLTTAFAAMTAYAILGTSRHLKVTVSSTMAVMSAAVVAPIAAGDRGSLPGADGRAGLVVGVDPPRGRLRPAWVHLRLHGEVSRHRLRLRPGDHDHHRPAAEAARGSGRERPDPDPARQPGRGAAGHEPADPGGRTAVDRGGAHPAGGRRRGSRARSSSSSAGSPSAACSTSLRTASRSSGRRRRGFRACAIPRSAAATSRSWSPEPSGSSSWPSANRSAPVAPSRPGMATRSIPTRSWWHSVAPTCSSGLFGGFTTDASLSQSATAESAGAAHSSRRSWPRASCWRRRSSSPRCSPTCPTPYWRRSSSPVS